MTSRRTKISPKTGRGLGHVTHTIFGSTVGYPGDSLASCNSFDELLDSADHALFRVIVRNPHHVLHHYSLRAKELFTIYANLPMD